MGLLRTKPEDYRPQLIGAVCAGLTVLAIGVITDANQRIDLGNWMYLVISVVFLIVPQIFVITARRMRR
jgi:heme/copper-type cytochrome/quinol oxidase subunit 2